MSEDALEALANSIVGESAAKYAGGEPDSNPEQEPEQPPEEKPEVVPLPPKPEIETVPEPQPEVAANPEKKMSKRRRSTMANEKKVLNEPPQKQLAELLEKFGADVGLPMKIWRRNERGHVAFLGLTTITPSELQNIEMWLMERGGGGRYMCAVQDPGDANQLLVSRFDVRLDPNVAPKPWQNDPEEPTTPGIGGSMINNGGYGAPPPSPGQQARQTQQYRVDPRMLPPWVRGLPHDQQVGYAQNAGIPLIPAPNQGNAPQARWASDDLAKSELDHTREELTKERMLREQDRKEAESRFNQLMERMDQLQQTRREEQARLEREAQQSQLQALRDEMQRRDEQFKHMLQQQQNTPKMSPEAIAAIVGGAAPVLSAFITSSKDREAIAVERQAKMMEAQAHSMDTFLKATLAKTDTKPWMDLLKVAAPILVPALKDFWDAKSPKAQADLVATMAENNLTSISMMFEMLNQVASSSPEPPWWLPMVQETMSGVVKAAEGMAGSTVQSVQGNQPQQQQQVQQPQPQQGAQMAAAPTVGHQYAQMILNSPMFPNEFREPHWMEAIVAIHNRQSAKEVGEYVATMIRELDAANMLPQQMSDVWDEPDNALKRLLEPLPIWRLDQGYAVQVINETIEVLSSDPEEQAAMPVQPQQPIQAQPQAAPVPNVTVESSGNYDTMSDFGTETEKVSVGG